MMDAISTRTIRSSQQDPSITSTTDQTKQNKTTKRINKIYGNILRRALFFAEIKEESIHYIFSLFKYCESNWKIEESKPYLIAHL